MKPPTRTPEDREKIEQYERFLDKLALCQMTFDHDGIREMLSNADVWSYSHRRGNGELTDEEQQGLTDAAFWKLCNTPESDRLVAARQKKYSELAGGRGHE